MLSEKQKIKEEYCKEFGYGSFNKYNENDYSKWLEQQLIIHSDSKRFCLLTDSKPPKSGKVEIITSRGRVIEANYDTLCGNDIWEVGYDLHKLNESVVAWR